MDEKNTALLTKAAGLALAIKKCLIEQAEIDGSVTVESVINKQWRGRDRDLAGNPDYQKNISEEMQLFWEARKMLQIEPYLERPVREYVAIFKTKRDSHLN